MKNISFLRKPRIARILIFLSILMVNCAHLAAQESRKQTTYVPQEFASYLAVLALNNHLGLIDVKESMVNPASKRSSLKNYVQSVYIIWSSNEKLHPPLISETQMDTFLSGMSKRLEAEGLTEFMDDPLSLLQADSQTIMDGLNGILLPQHLECFYLDKLNRDVYVDDIKNFKTAVKNAREQNEE